MNISDQIRAAQEKRAGFVSKMEAILSKAAEESREPTDAEQAEFDAAEQAITKQDKHLASLESLERQKAAAARPVNASQSNQQAPVQGSVPAEARAPARAKGLGFVQMAIALGESKRIGMSPVEYAQHRWPQHQDVQRALKGMLMADIPGMQTRAAVDPMSTDENAGAGGGGLLVATRDLAAEFVELLRPETIVGRMPGITRLDFGGDGRLTIPSQAGGSVAGYVGEGNSIRVSRMSFGQIELVPSKMATIIPVSNELLRRSNPSVEMMIRNDMVNAVAELLDISFLSSAAAGAAPAGILNGVTASGAIDVTGVGYDAMVSVPAAVQDMLTEMRAANVPMRAPIWIMHHLVRETFRFMRDAQDRFLFRAELDAGTFFGYPVLATNNVPTAFGAASTSFIALVDAADIIYAEDQQPVIDVSDQASIQSDTAPATPPAAPYVSAFQQDMQFFRIRASHTWKRRRDAAVRFYTYKYA